MGQRGYPPEFRRRVLDLVEAGRPIAEVAKALGISDQSISTWRRREVSFRALATVPLTAGKRTWAGSVERRRRLVAAEIAVPDDLGLAGRGAGVDDVLDAAAPGLPDRIVTNRVP